MMAGFALVVALIFFVVLLAWRHGLLLASGASLRLDWPLLISVAFGAVLFSAGLFVNEVRQRGMRRNIKRRWESIGDTYKFLRERDEGGENLRNKMEQLKTQQLELLNFWIAAGGTLESGLQEIARTAPPIFSYIDEPRLVVGDHRIPIKLADDVYDPRHLDRLALLRVALLDPTQISILESALRSSVQIVYNERGNRDDGSPYEEVAEVAGDFILQPGWEHGPRTPFVVLKRRTRYPSHRPGERRSC